MDGWIVIYRSLADHNVWTAEPFTRGQAWVDLLMLANHKPGFVRKQGIRVDLDRGDVGYGELELAARWKWSRGKVRRFLDELKTDHMITRKIVQADGEKQDKQNDSKQDKRRFTISILNYDKYQSQKKNDDTSDDTGGGTGDEHKVVQAADKRQDKRRYKNNNDNNENNNIIPESLSAYAEFATRYQNHIASTHGAKAPKVTGGLIKSCAEEIDKLVRIDGHSFDSVQSTMKWAIKDSFWALNTLSLAALRKKGDDGLTKFQKILAAKDRSAPAPRVQGTMLTFEQMQAMVAVN